MATHDYVIDNQTAPNFRADLNNALQAIVSNNSGSTAPTVTYANMMWYDTANNLLRMRNEADDAFITLGTLDQVANTFAASVALASEAEAEAGTENTKLMTPLRVKQSIVENAVFTRFFESSGQTITTAGALTLAHGLGVAPKMVQPFLRCVTAQLGYLVDDEVPVNMNINVAANQSQGQAITYDATNILVRYGATVGVYQLVRKDTGGVVSITPANFSFFVRAYA